MRSLGYAHGIVRGLPRFAEARPIRMRLLQHPQGCEQAETMRLSPQRASALRSTGDIQPSLATS